MKMQTSHNNISIIFSQGIGIDDVRKNAKIFETNLQTGK